MRILHISTRLILGGSQENTVLSCEEQARRGHEVHLAFGPIYGPEGSLLERVRKFNAEIAQAGRLGHRECQPITTHVVPHLVREVSPGADWRCVGELRDLIARLRPDIVHTHSSKAGILGRRAAWQKRHLHWGGAYFVRRGADPEDPGARVDTPPPGASMADYEAIMYDAGVDVGIVHTIHGPPFMPVEGGPLKRAKVRLLNWVYTLAERSAARECHRIVSVADAMTREFLRRGIGASDQYVTVRSGMEVEPYLRPAPGESREEIRRDLGVAPGDFVVGTVARLAEHKGHDDLLDALGEDLQKNPSWKLLWVGDGWWRERLVARARAMGLGVVELDRGEAHNAQRETHNQGGKAHSEQLTIHGEASSPRHRVAASSCQVLLTGLVPPERIPAMMRAMDVLAHPSYREGLPRTVPQALLCGVCPVAYDVDGTGEACIDLKTGRLVPLGDRLALREALRWCAEHPQRRDEIALAGRAMCEREFSVRAMVDGLDRVYAQAIDLARGGVSGRGPMLRA